MWLPTEGCSRGCSFQVSVSTQGIDPPPYDVLQLALIIIYLIILLALQLVVQLFDCLLVGPSDEPPD